MCRRHQALAHRPLLVVRALVVLAQVVALLLVGGWVGGGWWVVGGRWWQGRGSEVFVVREENARKSKQVSDPREEEGRKTYLQEESVHEGTQLGTAFVEMTQREVERGETVAAEVDGQQLVSCTSPLQATATTAATHRCVGAILGGGVAATVTVAVAVAVAVVVRNGRRGRGGGDGGVVVAGGSGRVDASVGSGGGGRVCKVCVRMCVGVGRGCANVAGTGGAAGKTARDVLLSQCPTAQIQDALWPLLHLS
jgi:hypothetical protein